MELAWYLFLFLLTLGFIVRPNLLKNQIIFFLFLFITAIITSVIIRLSDSDSILSTYQYKNDITYYSSIMLRTNLFNGPILDNVIYIREPFTYLLLIGSFTLTQDKILAFIFIDIIAFILLFRGIFLILNYCTKSSLRLNFLYFAIFLFFPFTFGMHITLRQYFATIFIICSIGYALNGFTKKSMLFLLISTLNHNSAGLLGPLILFLNNKKILNLGAYIGSALIPFAMYYIGIIGDKFKMQQLNTLEVGGSIDTIFALIFLVILTLFFLTIYLKPGKNDKLIILIPLYSFYIAILANLFFNSANTERMCMMLMAVLYPFIFILADEKFRQKIAARLCLFIISILPTVFIYNII